MEIIARYSGAKVRTGVRGYYNSGMACSITNVERPQRVQFSGAPPLLNTYDSVSRNGKVKLLELEVVHLSHLPQNTYFIWFITTGAQLLKHKFLESPPYQDAVEALY